MTSDAPERTTPRVANLVRDVVNETLIRSGIGNVSVDYAKQIGED